jgi:hypothetical protein
MAAPEDKWIDIIGPQLEPGEVVEVAVVGQIGTVSARRQVATALVVGAATFGTMTAFARARRAALVLKDRRLILFETGPNGTKPRKNVIGALPRGSFRLEPVSSLVTRKYDLVTSDAPPVRLTFAVTSKSRADELARRLERESGTNGPG